jgi:hypothetical protein
MIYTNALGLQFANIVLEGFIQLSDDHQIAVTGPLSLTLDYQLIPQTVNMEMSMPPGSTSLVVAPRRPH